MSKLYKFPKFFLWGTATSAHQTEGNNTNSDWWAWEQKKDYSKNDRKYPLEPSLIACDSYNRYEEDFDLCVKLNNNAVRISIEWARIETQEGHFDSAEIGHYRKVLEAAKKRNLKTFVTLHHFTNPIWFSKKGGWLNPFCSKYFSRYSKFCSENLGDLTDTFLTINEPEAYALMGYTRGIWPPCKRNIFYAFLSQLSMMIAHTKAYNAIKSVNKNYKVGIVKNIVWVETLSNKSPFWDKITVRLIHFFNSDFFIWPIRKHLDLIGLNYYFTMKIKNLWQANPNDKVSDLGWWLYPGGIKSALLDLKKYGLPIYITENGVADSKDVHRKDFIEGILIECAEAIKEGSDLRGYFHWTLIDNYEWHEGFWPRFGLVEIDRENGLKRVPRGSFYYYAEICKNNRVKIL